MIKLKDILLEGKPPSILVPRRTDDRVDRLINLYIRNGNKGDLNLSSVDITQLPDNLKTVDGNLYLYFSKITKLPDNLTVNGVLNLQSSKIREIPKNLNVLHDLILRNTPLADKYNSTQLQQLFSGVKGDVIV
jgi:hypothetical protein